VSDYRLSERAEDDVAEIFAYLQAEAGDEVANRMAARIDRAIRRLSAGLAFGHKRPDVPRKPKLLFLVERPYVISFDPERRLVIRILHGARDFRRALRG
jgi:plasmid stabilization system protein ParE